MKSERLSKIYFWLTNVFLAMYIVASIYLHRANILPDWEVLLVTGVSVFGTMITLLLSSQKQALEELTVIRQLFKEFNDRYHDMNDDLTRIKKFRTDEPLSDDDENILYDYFNLCSEEYLYFKRGYIYAEVWRAWCNGMLDYLNNEQIGNLWKKEEQTNSYYGLTHETILQGSKLDSQLK